MFSIIKESDTSFTKVQVIQHLWTAWEQQHACFHFDAKGVQIARLLASAEAFWHVIFSGWKCIQKFLSYKCHKRYKNQWHALAIWSLWAVQTWMEASKKCIHLFFFPDPVALRLVNGSSFCAGRVEVLHKQLWGTVCDDGWDMNDAAVVCRQLGCGVAVSAPDRAWFGRGHIAIWMDDVNCTGGEDNLLECLAKPWGEHNCDHGEDAGVVCSGKVALLVWKSLWACRCHLLAELVLLWECMLAGGWGGRDKWKMKMEFPSTQAESDLARLHLTYRISGSMVSVVNTMVTMHHGQQCHPRMWVTWVCAQHKLQGWSWQ